MRILIIEDDESGRENLADILELDGHQVVGASNASQSLERCRDDEFDCIIVDWKLPDESANRLIPRLQELQPDRPIIVVTGYGDVDLVVSAMRSGVYDYLEKPVNPSVLNATLARVAERQQYRQQLESVQQQLLSAERLAAIGQMVAGLAHESRNAFQRSQAGLEMLELNLEGDEDNLKIVAKIQKALEELQKLYEEVREYAAPIILANDQVNVASLVNDCWREIAGIREIDRVQLELEVEPAVRDQLFTMDVHRFHQVLRNLLENAIDATLGVGKSESKNAGEQKIRIRIFIRSGDLCITIQDSGPGISPEDAESIFEPFFTTKTQGTGLGLAISQRVIDKHGGVLRLLDQPGGACFEIALPLARIAPGFAAPGVESGTTGN